VKLNGTVKVAGGIAAIATVVAMAFGAWFTVMDAIAGEAEKLGGRIDTMQLQEAAEDVDFAIYQVTHKMDVVEARIDNGQAYSSDLNQLHQLERELDVLLRRQDTVLRRIEATLTQ
jgi:predicted  nucleic acid-binding Zn-ribbon protein